MQDVADAGCRGCRQSDELFQMLWGRRSILAENRLAFSAGIADHLLKRVLLQAAAFDVVLLRRWSRALRALDSQTDGVSSVVARSRDEE